jgi:LPXTG-site transpeptidase (sortase) family protein
VNFPKRQAIERTFLCIGAAMLMYAGGTLVYGRASQMDASRRFGRDVIAATRHPDLAEGDPVGRLEVPRLRISVLVLQGVEDRTLVAGAGHVPGTPSPGSDGNVVIAAHRDTFFRTLERVVPGDRIQIDTATWRHEYIVESTEVVDPNETRVMESRGRRELTLITCYPSYFVGPAPRRFVVHARPLEDQTVVRVAVH